MSDENVIARFTPEEFLAEGRATFTDPEVQRKQELQRARLRQALEQSIVAFDAGLSELSKDTANRLVALGGAALDGDHRSVQLFMAMYGELVWQALRP